VIRLETPKGLQTFVVEGIYYDYSSDLGYIIMPRLWYLRFYGDTRINNLAVYAKPHQDVIRLREQVLQAVGSNVHLTIRSNQELRQEVLRIFDKTFSITYALHVIAIAVALLTIMNALFALVLEARREFAILSYLGASRLQIVKVVLSMAGMLGLWGNVSGLGVGFVLSWLLIQVINKQSFGWTIRFELPVLFLLQSVALVFITALCSGLIPARIAFKTPAPQVIKLE
jgi:putative ABC transport system permease protein